MIDISIHAPLTGSDYRSCSYWICSSYFNPRSPHRERLLIHWVMCLVRLFQSTLSSQGATQSGIRSVQIKEISIHAPLTGSDIEEEGGASKVLISIHAPLTGSDDFLFFHIYLLLFQSTLPSQGATKSTSSYTAKILISIHAPLTGSDLFLFRIIHDINRFQSTLPSQGATVRHD